MKNVFNGALYYMEYAGLRFPVDLSIASPFSWQNAICKAGPPSALESMRAKPTFRYYSVNIGLMYKQ